jgi:pSer/pThr/pTyr-binding forkhead associated (FHA) protein
MIGFLHVAKRQALSLPRVVMLKSEPGIGDSTFGAMPELLDGTPQQILTLFVVRSPSPVKPDSLSVAGGRRSVGRDPANDWVLPDRDAQISRRHFIVVYQERSWQLIDLPMNGIFLNRERRPIGPGNHRILSNGDRIRLGPYEVKVGLTDVKSDPGLPGDDDDPGGADRKRPVGTDIYSAAALIEAYLERLLKLIPSEVVSIYPVGRSLLDGASQGFWAVICLIICVVFRSRLTRGADGRPQWDVVGISAISFVIWIYVLGSHLPGLNLFLGHQVWPALAMIVWTTITPTIYMARSA